MEDLFFGLDDGPVIKIPIEPESASRLQEVRATLPVFRQDVIDGLLQSDPDAAWRYTMCRQPGAGFVGYCPSCEASSPDFHAVYHPSGCMLRICPDCAQAVANPIRDRYRPLLEYLFDHCRKGWSVKGITLTTNLQLGEESEEAARRVIDETMQWCEDNILCHEGAGVIISLEAGEKGQKWHAHITAYSPFIRQADISRTWSIVSPGNSITWVRRYETVEAALTEGLKYSTKFVNLSPKQLVNLHNALKGTRRIRSRGCFYKSKNNPLAALIGADTESHCTCPQCNSKLTWCNEREFQQVKNARPWLVDKDAPAAIKWLQARLPLLNSTDQLSPSNRGSP